MGQTTPRTTSQVECSTNCRVSTGRWYTITMIHSTFLWSPTPATCPSWGWVPVKITSSYGGLFLYCPHLFPVLLNPPPPPPSSSSSSPSSFSSSSFSPSSSSPSSSFFLLFLFLVFLFLLFLFLLFLFLLRPSLRHSQFLGLKELCVMQVKTTRTSLASSRDWVSVHVLLSLIVSCRRLGNFETRSFSFQNFERQNLERKAMVWSYQSGTIILMRYV